MRLNVIEDFLLGQEIRNVLVRETEPCLVLVRRMETGGEGRATTMHAMLDAKRDLRDEENDGASTNASPQRREQDTKTLLTLSPSP